MLKTWYDSVCVVPFPDHCRKYNEVVVLGIKLAKMESYWDRPDSDVFIDQPITYEIPAGTGPGNRFVKISMTDDELEAAFADSPLNEMLKPPVVGQVDSPPLELSTGHLALLLASGHLDGLVQPPGEPPHVVRGTARKAEYVKETERSVGKGGDVTHKTVVGEKIELIIRAVDHTGVIRTFTQSQQPARAAASSSRPRPGTDAAAAAGTGTRAGISPRTTDQRSAARPGGRRRTCVRHQLKGVTHVMIAEIPEQRRGHVVHARQGHGPDDALQRPGVQSIGDRVRSDGLERGEFILHAQGRAGGTQLPREDRVPPG